MAQQDDASLTLQTGGQPQIDLFSPEDLENLNKLRNRVLMGRESDLDLDDFDALSQDFPKTLAPLDSTERLQRGYNGMIQLMGVGVNEFNQGLAEMLGLPGDAMQAVMSELGVQNPERFAAGGEEIKGLMEQSGMINPEFDPQTRTQRLVGGAGKLAGESVLPTGAAMKGGQAALQQGEQIKGLISKMLSEFASQKGGTKRALLNEFRIASQAGAAGKAATEFLPDTPQLLQDFGITTELGGQLAGSIGPSAGLASIKSLFSFLLNRLIPKGLRQSAGQTIKQAIPTEANVQNQIAGEIRPAENIPVGDATQNARRLEGEIPGLDPTTGQAFQSAQVSLAERGARRLDEGLNRDFQTRITDQNRVLQEAVDQNIPPGEIQDTQAAIHKLQKGGSLLKQTFAQGRQNQLDALRNKIDSVPLNEVTGNKVRSRLQQLDEITSDEAGKLYSRVAKNDGLTFKPTEIRKVLIQKSRKGTKITPTAREAALASEREAIKQQQREFRATGGLGSVSQRAGGRGQVVSGEQPQFSAVSEGFDEELTTFMNEALATFGDQAAFKDLQAFRRRANTMARNEAGKIDANNTKISILNNFVDAAEATFLRLETDPNIGLRFPQAVQDLRTARTVFAPKAQFLRQGSTRKILAKRPGGDIPFITDDKVIKEILKDVNEVRRYKKAFAQGGAFEEAGNTMLNELEMGLRRDFADAVMNPAGEVDINRLKKFVRNNGPMINEFPNAKRDFAFTAINHDRINAFGSPGVRSVDGYEGRKFSEIVEASPDNIARMILKDNNPERLARTVMDAVKTDPAATRGLRRGIWERILNEAGISFRDLDNQPFFKPNELANKRIEYDRVLRELYTPQQLNRMDTIIEAHKLVSGSPFDVNLSKQGPNNDTLYTISNLVSRYYALKRGIVGRAYLVTEGAARRIGMTLNRFNDEKARVLINRALLDPEVAETILMIGNKSPQLVNIRLRAHFIDMGLEAKDQVTEEPPQRVEVVRNMMERNRKQGRNQPKTKGRIIKPQFATRGIL